MVDIEKLKRAKKKIKEHKKKISKNSRKRYSGVRKINWNEVGAGFLENLHPDSKEWKHIVSVLQRAPQNTERKKLVTKLGKEFMIIYGRYRRAAQRRDGLAGSYVEIPGELRLAQRTAVNCFLRGVRPAALIEHWDGGPEWLGMTTPPLTFLVSVMAVEGVGLKKKQMKAKEERPLRPEANHSFSDTGGLDPRLRPALTEAGFDLQDISDRFLLTVQAMAREKACGNDCFIPKHSKEYPLAMWAAKNLYRGEVDEDD